MKLFSFWIREIKNIAHYALGVAAFIRYEDPSKNIKVVGVTGTDGKTTTSYFIYQLLEMAGKKAALVSTVGVFMNGKKYPLGFHTTTPSPFTLGKYLRRAQKSGVEYVVLEVSSHALDQHRVFGIDFEVGTITNVTHEHLDYHRNIERYLAAKVKLLKKSKEVILNLEDPFIDKIKKTLNDQRVYTYSIKNKKADLILSDVNSDLTKWTEYNQKNLLAALLVVSRLGIQINNLSSLDKLNLPEGRLEYIKKTPFSVIVDFAHTPNAFSKLLPEIRKQTKGRIIHVFGSAGERDKGKRPQMGEESSRYADIIILTAEDPRSEKIEDINHGIKKKINKNFKIMEKEVTSKKINSKCLFEIKDRKEAIRFALAEAESGDTVIITGKGPEESMNMGNGEMRWNDISVTKELLTTYGN